jgi:hypothetical protein
MKTFTKNQLTESSQVKTFKRQHTFPGDTWIGLQVNGQTICGINKKSFYNRMTRKTEITYISDTFAGEYKTIKEAKEATLKFYNQAK